MTIKRVNCQGYDDKAGCFMVAIWEDEPVMTAVDRKNLIETAPDLLEACKYAFENLHPAGDIRKDFSGHNAMATLSKAIAKATGKEVSND